jgi:hypothetical protein
MTPKTTAGPFGTEPVLARSTTADRDAAHRRVRLVTGVAGGAALLGAGILSVTLAPATAAPIVATTSVAASSAAASAAVPNSLTVPAVPDGRGSALAAGSAPVTASGGS